MNDAMIATAPAFRFRRYREEVALRSSLQQFTDTEHKHDVCTDASAEATNDDNRARTRSSAESENEYDDSGDGTVIQNLSDVIIAVDCCGKVSTEKKTRDTGIAETTEQSEKQLEPICVVPEGTTLLLRNLRDCHVTIHLPLPAVHFVDIENTEISFYNQSKDDDTITNTTIHMTDCRGKSSLQLETSAQQLRIHRSIGLRVEMMNEGKAKPTNIRNHQPACNWKPGTIILEASKDIVFSVPPLAEETPAVQSQQEREQAVSSTINTVATTKTYWHQVIVKDFQWLRKGIASPNFQVEVLKVCNTDSKANRNSTEDSIEPLERAQNTLLHRNSNSEELESGNSSDSEDEL